jgi:3-hydroxyisobutyrate dehydrogenase
MGDDAKPVVGILGLGKMGTPIAGHLTKAGFSVIGFDPAARQEDFDPIGVKLVTSEAEAAEKADVLFVIVGFDEEVKNIVLAPEFQARCKDGLILAIVSTVLPATLLDIEKQLPDRVTLVDCPVARGQKAADEARLLAFAAGDSVAVERCLPALRAFCTDVEHVGGIGSGQVAKMANNMMLWACFFGVFESMQLLRASGVDMDRVRTALMKSSAYSFALDLWPNARPVWARDDLVIAREVAAQLGVDVSVTAAIAEAFEKYPDPEKVYASGG